MVTLNDKTASASTADLKALPASLGSAFVADSPAPEVNAGYPALYWQRGVTQVDLSGATADAIPNQTYTGSALMPVPSNVAVDGKTLSVNKDYVASYESNVNAGTATVTLTGVGLYTGTKTLSFTIDPKDVADAEIADIAAMWAAPSIPAEPALTVKNAAGTAMVAGTDYTVSYTDNAATGTATATVRGIGNYTGTKDATFTVECTKVDVLPGSGTTADPYTISSKDELEFAALAVNNAMGAYPYAAYKLAADVDGSTSDGRIATGSIGMNKNKFQGVFDGSEKTVTLANPLFGYVEGGEVSNVTVVGTMSLVCESATDYKAAVICQAIGDMAIENCVNKASVTTTGKSADLGGIVGFVKGGSSVAIKNCVNEGTLTSVRGAGGILANNSTNADVQIEGCFNKAAVSSMGTGNVSANAGGIAANVTLGYEGTLSISKCGNSGALTGYYNAGGIVAYATVSVGTTASTSMALSDVYNTGAVKAQDEWTAYADYGAGGIVGAVGMVGSTAGCTITNAYNAGKVVGKGDAGAVVGNLSGATGLKIDNVYWGDATASASVGKAKNPGKLSDNSKSATDAELKATGADGMAATLGESFYDDTAASNGGYPVLERVKAELVVPAIKKQDYTGQAVKPAVTVYNVSTSPKTTLAEGTDYVLALADNVEVGTASVSVVGIGAYEGSLASTTFQIVPCALSKCTVDEVPAQTATGSAVEPELVVKNPAGVQLQRGVDYDVSFANNVGVGEATYAVVPKTGSYTGAIVGSFKIAGKSIEGASVEVPSPKTTGADQSADLPAQFKVKDADGKFLEEGTDFTVSFEDADGNPVSEVKDKGDYTAVIAGCGNYSGSVEARFAVSPFLTVKQNRAGAGEQVLAEYSKADFEALADNSGTPVSGLYGGDGKWKVSTAASYVVLSKLFDDAFSVDAARAADDPAKANADNMTAAKAYSEKNTTSVSYASGDFGVSKTWSELEEGRFYKNTTQTARDDSAYDKAPAVLSVTEASSAIEEGKAASDAESANKAAASTGNEPRMVLGMSEADYAAGSFAGKSFVSGVDSVTVSYDEPVVMKVAVQFGADGEASVVKSYTDAEFRALSTGPDATPVSGMFYKGDAWHVTSTDNYVPAETLFADAGVAGYWKSGTGLSFGATKGGSVTYDLIESQKWFFPNAMGGQSLDPDTKAAAPFVLSVTEWSGACGESQTAAEVQAANIAQEGTKNYPRTIWGISEEDYRTQGSGQDSQAGGWRYWNNTEQITLIVNDKIEVADLDPASYDYTGSAVEPKPVVKAGGKTLVEGEDYSLEYRDNVEVGTGAVTVVFDREGAYKGQPSVEKTFAIKAAVQPSAGAAAWKRLSGNTAIGTMKQIVNEGWGSSEWAVVATKNGYQDALSASGLAGLLDCPILMTDPKSLTDATAKLIKSKGVKHVVVVGGTSA
ncbi:cell wall-binding repeat-containing protein, partial [Paratractidigestivibacter sp.]|uniref:cell wall-binding repeat-containing protein n=1 Tax=Paratractidigestivibacter sp. TaxID=2847316 RepID=UPI002ABDF94A